MGGFKFFNSVVNSNFTNASYKTIMTEYSKIISISNSSFVSCNGGILIRYITNASVSVSDSSFINSSVVIYISHGGTGNAGTGNANLKVINSNFTNSSDGVITISSHDYTKKNITCIVINSRFVNSSASSSWPNLGGTIVLIDDSTSLNTNIYGTVINSTFINSSANVDNENYYNNGCGNGGAIYIQNGNVTNCTFINSSVRPCRACGRPSSAPPRRRPCRWPRRPRARGAHRS